MPAAASSAATPIQKTMPTIRFTIVVLSLSMFRSLSAPPFALDRLRGEKQSEGDEADVVDQVRRIDDAFREVVEVIDDRQVAGQLVSARSEEAADPGDDPQKEEHGKGDRAGDDLVLR